MQHKRSKLHRRTKKTSVRNRVLGQKRRRSRAAQPWKLLAVVLACLVLSQTAWGEALWGLMISSVAGGDIRDPASVMGQVLGQQRVLQATAEEDIYLGTPAEPLALRLVQPAKPATEGLHVLVYHTHATEAYTATNQNPYRQTDEWRTDDQTKNVVKLGTDLTNALNSRGFVTWHATTDHEPPKLSTAYTRSILTMQAADEAHNIDLFIDLHRDAYIAALKEPQTVLVDGKPAARMMFVVATGEGKDGSEYPVKPDWKTNLALAQAVTNAVNARYPGLMKEPMLRTARFNQHLGLSLLIEIGNNENTLEEAMRGVTPLAEGLAACADMMQKPAATKAKELTTPATTPTVGAGTKPPATATPHATAKPTATPISLNP